MAQVINSLHPLTHLNRNSKIKWRKRFTSNPAFRFLLSSGAFFILGFSIASTIQNKQDSNNDKDGVYHRHSLEFNSISAKINSPNYNVSKPATKSTPSSQNDGSFGSISQAFQQQVLPSLETNTSSIRQDIMRVIHDFMNTAPLSSFDAMRIREHFELDENNMKRTAILVTIKNGLVNFTHDFPEARHGRAGSVKYILNKIIADRATKGAKPLPDVTFLVMVSDGHGTQVATFGSARHWRHWDKLIPVPLGNRRGLFLGWGTPLEGWDDYVKSYITNTHANFSWNNKIEKALFRGTLGMQSYTLGSCNWQNNAECRPADNWTQVNRGVLFLRTKAHPDLFDIGFTSLKRKDNSPPGTFDDAPPCVRSVRFRENQRYKYLLNVGSNQDWAERLRVLLFTNSAVVMHEAETQEFFTPLMKPWVHYIPTNLMMTDLVSNVKWAKQHDDEVRNLVHQQNAFAQRYISEEAMQLYWELSIEEFASRQQQLYIKST